MCGRGVEGVWLWWQKQLSLSIRARCLDRFAEGIEWQRVLSVNVSNKGSMHTRLRTIQDYAGASDREGFLICCCVFGVYSPIPSITSQKAQGRTK